MTDTWKFCFTISYSHQDFQKLVPLSRPISKLYEGKHLYNVLRKYVANSYEIYSSFHREPLVYYKHMK